MKLKNLIYLCIIFSLTISSLSMPCSFNYKPEKYLSVMKIYGKKNKDIQVYEAVYALGYTGPHTFKVFSKDMKLLINQENGTICTYDKIDTPICSDAKGKAVDLRLIHNFYDSRKKLQLFIQINDEPIETYFFKKRRVKATQQHHDQIINQGWNICYEEV